MKPSRVEPGAVIRAEVVKARARGYTYRPVVSYSHGSVVDEQGNVYDRAADIARTLFDSGGAIVVTHEPGRLYSDLSTAAQDASIYRTHSLACRFSDAAPESENEPWVSKSRFVGFGWRSNGTDRTHKRQCLILDVSRFLSSPGASSQLADDDHASLLSLGIRVREFCKSNDMPIRCTAGGLASALLRDRRFIGEATARVPKATNERVRPHLPGVHMEAVAPIGRLYRNATSLDQRRAYHRAAQTVLVPDPRHLYARGYFSSYENHPEEAWLKPEHPEFHSTLTEHGLFIVQARCLQKPPKFALPMMHTLYQRATENSSTPYATPIWSSELKLAIEQGLTVDGILACWTTAEHDRSIPIYGKWAEGQIDSATPDDATWLKPVLHARYGMLGSRPRRLFLASTLSKKPLDTTWNVSGQMVRLAVTELPASAPASTNVSALGVIQAAIRARSLQMAQRLSDGGLNVLHVHADGLHVEDGQLPLLGSDWTAEPITNLAYEDAVSWTSDQRDVLPGRDLRLRVDGRRHRARMTNAARDALEQKSRVKNSGLDNDET